MTEGNRDSGTSPDSRLVYRKLALRVVLALALVGVLASTEFLISKQVVDSQSAYAQLINVSGRQRMLSQRIAALAVEASREAARHGAAREGTRDDLHAAVDQMRAAHTALAHGDSVWGMPPPDETVAAYYFAGDPTLDMQVRSFLEAAERVERDTRTGVASENDLDQLAREARHPLLQGLDGAVLLYQKAAEDAQTKLSVVTLVLWLAMLATLLICGVFVIWPALRHVRDSMARVEEARYDAERANAAKTQFLSSMSHEIRTPMNGIIGMADLLASGPLAPTQRRYAEIVQRSARSLLSILNDILDVSKMEADQLVLEAVPFNLSRLITEAAEVFGSDCSEKGLDLSLDLRPELDTVVLGDPTRIRQVLTNLISNALKFTKKGGVTIRAQRTEVTENRIRVRIEVVDTGIGFDPAAAEQLFEAFTQEDESTTRRFGGTGLGLAIVKRIIDAMDGTVRAEGRPGAGATFAFEVPLELSAEIVGDSPKPSVIADEGDDAPDWSSARLLVAEDNETNRELIGTLLAALGCGLVDFAEDGIVAVQKAGAMRYDLILMDSQMPNMDGIEAARTIRSTGGPNAAATIVALTADALDRARERYLGHGFDDYLPKPVVPNALFDVLNRHIVPPKQGPQKAEATAESQ